MNTFEINIDGKKYEYITSKCIDGVNYLAYADEENIYVAKYSIVGKQIKLTPISEDTLSKIKGELGLE